MNLHNVIKMPYRRPANDSATPFSISQDFAARLFNGHKSEHITFTREEIQQLIFAVAATALANCEVPE